MTDARVEKIHADRLGAGDFFAQAEMFLADAAGRHELAARATRSQYTPPSFR